MVTDEDEADNESSTQDAVTKNAHRFPKGNRDLPTRFGLNVQVSSWSKDKATAREAMEESKSSDCHGAMSKETQALYDLDCWEEAERPRMFEVSPASLCFITNVIIEKI